MTRIPQDTEVLVVGGGPAGASTAWHLARLGVRVVLVDRAQFPRDKPCAEYLSPEASRILSAMGALQEIERAGAAHLAGMMVRAPSGATIRGEFAASHGFRGFRDSGLALRRTVLDALLLDCARDAGATIVEGAKVEGLLLDGNRCVGASVRFESALHSIRASLVVGADGLRSIVARRLELAHTARWPRRLAIVTHYRNIEGMGSFGEMHVERHGYVGLADVGNGLTNVALVVPHRRGSTLPATPEKMLQQWIASHDSLGNRFNGAERVTPVRVTGPFASQAVRAWAPGAALVGDAADFFDPFTGEGMYAALRGGELLAPFVQQAVHASTPGQAIEALKAYDRARHETFSGKWKVERLIGLAVAYPTILEHAARVMQADPELADLFVGVAGDFIPPRAILNFQVARRLLFPRIRPRTPPTLPLHGHRS